MSKTDLSLYGITQEIEALDEILMEEGGEISETFEQLQDKLTMTISQKVDGCSGYINRENDIIDLAKDRIKKLNDFIKVRKNKIDRFNSYVKLCLEKTGKEKFVGDFNEIKLRKPSDIVIIDDENKIPMDFQVVETIVKIKKAELKKALKVRDVPGARLGKGSSSVMIGMRK